MFDFLETKEERFQSIQQMMKEEPKVEDGNDSTKAFATSYVGVRNGIQRIIEENKETIDLTDDKKKDIVIADTKGHTLILTKVKGYDDTWQLAAVDKTNLDENNMPKVTYFVTRNVIFQDVLVINGKDRCHYDERDCHQGVSPEEICTQMDMVRDICAETLKELHELHDVPTSGR